MTIKLKDGAVYTPIETIEYHNTPSEWREKIQQFDSLTTELQRLKSAYEKKACLLKGKIGDLERFFKAINHFIVGSK